jgi:predicted nuclease with TOPRIM domain
MTTEQWLQWGMGLAALILGGGGIAALAGVFVTRKLGLKTHENEASRDTNNAWDSIVDNLQKQITENTAQFHAELTGLRNEVKEMRNRQTELETALNSRDRLILKAIAFINKLEMLVPEHLRITRPEGLE